MEARMVKREMFLCICILIGFVSDFIIQVNAEKSLPVNKYSRARFDRMRRMEAFKAALASSNANSPSPSPSVMPNSRVYYVTSYGADPTGKIDSTQAIQRAISDAAQGPNGSFSLINGILNVGGAQINLGGGIYKISSPLGLPAAGLGNLVIQGGTLKASDDFAADGYLIDLSASRTPKGSGFNYEYVTLRDLMLDCNYRGGGIQVINSLRTSIDNCYIVHFNSNSNGILVQGGHETYIRNCYLGQRITAGADSGERNFGGTAINLMGNDNAITDVVIFSAAVGIMISGQANIISGVHCYNKATGFGGIGIYIRLPGNTQTRIVNSYLDFNGIVAEDPVQLHISNCFFLGDGYVVLKSINGIVKGVNIVDNMFSGSYRGVKIVQLDQGSAPFKQIDQVVVDRNNVQGMNVKATVARASVQGAGPSWTIDLNSILLFPDLIKQVHYSFSQTGNSFPNHALRSVSNNRVLIESDSADSASIFVTVDQGI